MRTSAPALVVAVVLALVAPSAARAALCIRLKTLPTRPHVGRSATVELRTYYVPMADGTLRPWAVPSYPFRMEAVSPRGSVYRIAVRRTRDRYLWRGRFRFPTRGRWTIRVTNWGPSYPKGCGEVLRVRVT